jgi:cellulose synthase/poly-beta-1,6-N-acetylglucosamine synthase-like glycosyltransferase
MAELRAASILFWAALSLIAYVYLGYPAIAWLRRRLGPRPVARAAVEPHVTIVVVAHNEGHCIARRIENLLCLDYPRERLAILVGSDGSTDDTVEVASRYRERRVTVRHFGLRRGKAAVLNDLVAAAETEIVVFADARQRFERGAVRALVANFADPQVGAVSGELHLVKRQGSSPVAEGSGFYWKYEKFIRANESWTGSTVGATGAIYAIRRNLFDAIPPDTILDDVLIPMRIVRRGYRVIFEAGARAHDLIATTPREDFTRKTRTIAGTFQLFARERWILNPARSRVWFQALSHKALRLTIPALHVVMLLANLALIEFWLYRALLAGQGVFYLAALVGYVQTRMARRHIIFTVPFTMCLLGWATIVGLGRFVARRQRVTWERMPGGPGPRVVSRPV